jgi:hypothetical protein
MDKPITVDDVNRIHESQEATWRIDKVSKPFWNKEYTSHYYINVLNQQPHITNNFRKYNQNAPEEYNNTLVKANGYDHIIVKYVYVGYNKIL